MMRVLRALLPKGRLRRAVALSVSSTVLSQLIVLAASPLLTRLYTPENFGILGVFSALLSILGIVVCLRYELAIPLSEDDAGVVNLLALSLVVTSLVSSLVGLILWLWGDVICLWLNAEALRPLLWLLPVALLAMGCYRALTHWAIRRQAFGRIARTRLSQSLGQVATQTGLGYMVPGPLGLLVGQAIGQSAGMASLAVAVYRSEGRLLRAIKPRAMAQAAARFGNLPTLATGAALLNGSARLFPTLLIAALYGAEVAGWFALAQRILSTPIFLSTAVSQVYLSEASRLARIDSSGINALFMATTWRLLSFGALSLGVVIIAGPQLFALVFGSAWTEAGRFAQVLAFMSLGLLVVNPIAQTLTVLHRQDIRLAWDAFCFGMLLLVFFAAQQLTWSPLLTIAVLSVGMTLCYVLLFVVTRRTLLAHLRMDT
jgi:O-antigen/teichoic acid export membrane protein